MNWKNLEKGLCPKCGGGQEKKPTEGLITCIDCDFSIRESKYMDLIKGKNSNAYKKVVNKYKNIKKANKEKKSRLDNARKQQEKEKEFNLKKMKMKNDNIKTNPTS